MFSNQQRRSFRIMAVAGLLIALSYVPRAEARDVAERYFEGVLGSITKDPNAQQCSSFYQNIVYHQANWVHQNPGNVKVCQYVWAWSGTRYYIASISCGNNKTKVAKFPFVSIGYGCIYNASPKARTLRGTMVYRTS